MQEEKLIGESLNIKISMKSNKPVYESDENIEINGNFEGINNNSI